MRRSHKRTTISATGFIAKRSVSYEPNSLGGGCPFQMGTRGFTSFPEPIGGDKVRGKPEKFADHYSQATLFWNSQTPWEKAHIVRGFRFELTKVQVPAIRERTVSMLRNVSDDLARRVADGLGIPLPKPMPRLVPPPRLDAAESPALSLTSRPGDGSIRGRKIAILIAGGVDAGSVSRTHGTLSGTGALVRLVAARLGQVAAGEDSLEVDATFETLPSVLFDAVVVRDGPAAAAELTSLGQAREFIRDQYRHGKVILMLGSGEEVVRSSGIATDNAADWAMVRDVAAFIKAVGRHRNWDRATDPPLI